mgnify:CR=1 FL=1
MLVELFAVESSPSELNDREGMTKQLLGGDICPGCNRGDVQGWFLYTAVTRLSRSEDEEPRLMILMAECSMVASVT